MLPILNVARGCVLVCGLALAALAPLDGAEAQWLHGYKVLYAFEGSDGAHPHAGLIMDGSGNLYGTTKKGGAHNQGTVYKLAPDGTETVLHAFTGGNGDGAQPYAGLIMDSSGTLYGTTAEGGADGYGTVFKLAPDGTETVLHLFGAGNGGESPYAGQIEDSSGTLYGTTRFGGGTGCGVKGCGTVFELASGGTYTVLHVFAGGYQDGAQPYAGLMMDSSGTLYGTTLKDGQGGQCYSKNDHGYGCGTVFEVTQGGAYGELHTFCQPNPCPDGAGPLAGLIERSGILYGTTVAGGTDFLGGTVFSIDSKNNDTETVLHSFDGGFDGAQPHAGLIMDTLGNLYGTTVDGGAAHHQLYGYGTVFKLAPDGTETVLHAFTGGNSDGAYPYAGLIMDTAGNLYGTTSQGGTYGQGTVFRLSK